MVCLVLPLGRMDWTVGNTKLNVSISQCIWKALPARYAVTLLQGPSIRLEYSIRKIKWKNISNLIIDDKEPVSP